MIPREDIAKFEYSFKKFKTFLPKIKLVPWLQGWNTISSLVFKLLEKVWLKRDSVCHPRNLYGIDYTRFYTGPKVFHSRSQHSFLYWCVSGPSP